MQQSVLSLKPSVIWKAWLNCRAIPALPARPTAVSKPAAHGLICASLVCRVFHLESTPAAEKSQAQLRVVGRKKESQMVSTDPISDMFTRIRNAIAVNKHEVTMPHSKIKEAVAKILADNGFLASVSVSG